MSAQPIYTESLRVRKSSIVHLACWGALDSGCSLTKLVFVRKGRENDEVVEITGCTFLNDELESGLRYMVKHAWFPAGSKRFFYTGVNAVFRIDLLRQVLDGLEIVFVSEFDSLPVGFRFLMASTTDEFRNFCYDFFDDFHGINDVRLPTEVTYPCLHVVFGSGIIIHKLDDTNHSEYIGGGWICGRTMVGLAGLLLDIHNYDELMEAASYGDRRHVDLLKKDVILTGMTPYGPMKGEDSSFNMAKSTKVEKDVSGFRREDIAASIVGMIAHVCAQTLTTAMRASTIKDVFIVGNTPRHAVFRRYFYEQLHEMMPDVLRKVVFMKPVCLGALGVMVKQENLLTDDK